MYDIWGRFTGDSNWRSPTWGGGHTGSSVTNNTTIYKYDPVVAAELRHLRAMRHQRYLASLSPEARRALLLQHKKQLRKSKLMNYCGAALFFLMTFSMIYGRHALAFLQAHF